MLLNNLQSPLYLVYLYYYCICCYHIHLSLSLSLALALSFLHICCLFSFIFFRSLSDRKIALSTRSLSLSLSLSLALSLFCFVIPTHSSSLSLSLSLSCCAFFCNLFLCSIGARDCRLCKPSSFQGIYVFFRSLADRKKQIPKQEQTSFLDWTTAFGICFPVLNSSVHTENLLALQLRKPILQ